MLEIEELVKQALKTDDEKVVIKYAYAHTVEKWWHLRKSPYKTPPTNMVLLFVVGCKKTTKPISTHEHPVVGDVCHSEGGNVEILTVAWA